MTECRIRSIPWLLLKVLLLSALAGLGCRRETSPSAARQAPVPNSPALYGAPSGKPASVVQHVPPAATPNPGWQAAPFFVLETELSPATLVHSSTKHLGLFTGMNPPGPAGPSQVAWSTMNGPRSFKRGEKLDVTKMDENWVLVWWTGAEGWTNWDSPWVVYLQHKPATMKLDADGLHLDFPGAAGDVVLMPLYGYEKLPTAELDLLKAHGLPARKPKLETWKWPAGLTRDPLTRIRYWAAATRELPVYCEESIRVDRAKDSVTFRSHFTWYSIEDDWKTRHLKLAPLSPVLAHAVKEGGFPLTISHRWADLDLFTPYGPYLAIEGADSFDATITALQYVNETEATEPPDPITHASVGTALEILRGIGRKQFADAGRHATDQGASDDLSRVSENCGWYARALLYFDNDTRTNALAALRAFFHEVILVTNRFTAREFPQGSGRVHLELREPGSHSPAGPGGTGNLNAALLETLWTYAHFSGDWDLVRARWPLVKQLFTTPAAARWTGFGADGHVAIDGAAHCAAFARLAYQAGDMDAYDYACSMFARQLVLVFLKHRGAQYFREHQPYRSMEFMGEAVFLSQLQEEAGGWQISGPNYPPGASEGLFKKRWLGFRDFDGARFHREYLKDEVRRELDWLAARQDTHDPFRMPSFTQLRSLLLNESPTELAAVAASGQFSGLPAEVIASCISVLRTSRPTRYERLIPGGAPSPFVAGLEREGIGPRSPFLTSVHPAVATASAGTTTNGWPQLTWKGWRTDRGAPWSFGQVTPVREGKPKKTEIVPLNWNTRVLVFSPP